MSTLVFAASLSTPHPNFAPQQNLHWSNRWKAPPILERAVKLILGILSTGNNFAERMAIKKSWMQYKLIKSSNTIAYFFVALIGEPINSMHATNVTSFNSFVESF
ncbi:hydroxyproline O-galactosyltransferase GALT6-like, partial [Olea europaea subsp. europaea]